MDATLEQLAAWMNEARRREAWQVCLVPDEPVIYRGRPRQGRSAIERDTGDVLAAADTQAIAEAILGGDRLSRLGGETGTAEARVKLPDGTYASVTAARAGGEVTLIVRPVRTMGFDYRVIRLPEPIIAAAESANGLLIVTGPPGSGKTTTCYSILDHLNATRPIHIVTIGYHIEYVLEPKQALIQERQIGVDVPDMLTGIQSGVLQGADVVFVAEVRDLEVFNAALRAAEMDCLVLVQLHLPTPGAAIERMIALQPDQTRSAVQRSIAGGLRGVLAQCLLPTPEGRQMPAYGTLLPDAAVSQRILEGGQSLDELCNPRLDADIRALRDQGKVLAEAADEAVRRLQA